MTAIRNDVKNLGSSDKLYLIDRQILYYLKVPYFFGSPNVQALVELRKGRVRQKTLYRQLKAVGVTHVLLQNIKNLSGPQKKLPWEVLKDSGCLSPIKKFKLRVFKSRTLPNLSISNEEVKIFKFNDQKCPQK